MNRFSKCCMTNSRQNRYMNFVNNQCPWYFTNIYNRLYQTGCGLNMLSNGCKISKIICTIRNLY